MATTDSTLGIRCIADLNTIQASLELRVKQKNGKRGAPSSHIPPSPRLPSPRHWPPAMIMGRMTCEAYPWLCEIVCRYVQRTYPRSRIGSACRGANGVRRDESLAGHIRGRSTGEGSWNEPCVTRTPLFGTSHPILRGRNDLGHAPQSHPATRLPDWRHETFAQGDEAGERRKMTRALLDAMSQLLEVACIRSVSGIVLGVHHAAFAEDRL